MEHKSFNVTVEIAADEDIALRLSDLYEKLVTPTEGGNVSPEVGSYSGGRKTTITIGIRD